VFLVKGDDRQKNAFQEFSPAKIPAFCAKEM
jgi:hypothetical protein